jgi:hypothetical protein
VVAFLNTTMGSQLQGAGNQGAWADYAPDVTPGLPYAVVFDGPETYDFSSDDYTTGHYTSCIADGSIIIAFVAPTKAVVRLLARVCVLTIANYVSNIVTADGTLLELTPMRTESIPLTDSGPAVPTVFKRAVMCNYKEQFQV